MDFQKICQDLPEIKDCYQTGLKAIPGNQRQQIMAQETRSLLGSVHLDECSEIPNSEQLRSRWDFLVAYKDKVYAIEIHPANSGANIDELIDKARWLINWLRQVPLSIPAKNAKMELMEKMRKSDFQWVASGKVGVVLSPNSKKRKELAQLKIAFPPKERLLIDQI